MDLIIDSIITSSSHMAQRHSWTITGTMGGEYITFEYDDAGNNAEYETNFHSLVFGDTDPDLFNEVEEAISEWFYDNEDKLHQLELGEVISFDLEKTAYHQDNPKTCTDVRLIQNIQKAAERYAGYWDSPSTRRIPEVYNKLEEQLDEMMEQVSLRWSNGGLRRHPALQHVAAFKEEHPETTRNYTPTIAKKLAGLPVDFVEPEIMETAQKHRNLRRYIGRGPAR